MKKARRLFALLLTLAMVLTYMPAAAFAASSSKAVPTSVTFTYTDVPEVQAGSNRNYPGAEGEEFTVKYSDGRTETYKYMEFEGDEEEGDVWFDSGFYLNGDVSKEPVDDVDYLYFVIEPVKPAKRFQEGANDAVFAFEAGDPDDEWTRVECPVQVEGVKSDEVAAVKYEQVGGPISCDIDYGSKMFYYYGENSWLEPLAGDKLTVTYYDYDDETDEVIGTYDKEFVCQLYKDEENGESYYTFVGETITDEDGETYTRTIEPDLFDDQIEGEWTWKSGSIGEVTVSVEGVDAPQKLQVQVPEYKAIESAKLVLKDGFEPKVSAGQNDDIGSDAFYGEGNKIVVTYTDKTTEDFNYVEDTDHDMYGFFNSKMQEATVDTNLSEKKITLKKDVPADLTFEVNICYDEKNDIWDYAEFNYTITAKKQAVYVIGGNRYQYTGKVIKPKVVLKTSYGNKVLPASAYTYKAPKKKTIGEFWLEITLKDKNYYVADSWGDDNVTYMLYTITPYKPAIKKLKAAKKAITVSWTKLNKKKSKQIDGYAIEYSLKKNFSGAKTKYAKKTASSLKLTKLKSKKVYYVRIRTYKTVKETYYDENGKKHTNKYKVFSNPSKTLKIKAK